MKTSEQARIVEEFTANLRQTLLNNVGTMPENWNGCHIRAFAEIVLRRWNNTPRVKFAEKQIRKSDTLYSLNY